MLDSSASKRCLPQSEKSTGWRRLPGARPRRLGVGPQKHPPPARDRSRFDRHTSSVDDRSRKGDPARLVHSREVAEGLRKSRAPDDKSSRNLDNSADVERSVIDYDHQAMIVHWERMIFARKTFGKAVIGKTQSLNICGDRSLYLRLGLKARVAAQMPETRGAELHVEAGVAGLRAPAIAPVPECKCGRMFVVDGARRCRIAGEILEVDRRCGRSRAEQNGAERPEDQVMR